MSKKHLIHWTLVAMAVVCLAIPASFLLWAGFAFGFTREGIWAAGIALLGHEAGSLIGVFLMVTFPIFACALWVRADHYRDAAGGVNQN